MSRDNQQIISMGIGNKAYLWSLSTGELLESATDDLDYARLSWKGRNGWNGGEDAGVESNKKPQFAVLGQDIYIWDPTRNGNSFEKVGQFDDQVKGWGVDANGMLWVCFWRRNLTRLTMVTESSNTLQNFGNDDAI